MATIWDYLVGTGGDQTLGQEQTAESPLPEYLRDASARAIEAAKGVASEPYVAYGGPRVAGLNEAQRRAIAQQQGYAGQGVAGADAALHRDSSCQETSRVVTCGARCRHNTPSGHGPSPSQTRSLPHPQNPGVA